MIAQLIVSFTWVSCVWCMHGAGHGIGVVIEQVWRLHGCSISMGVGKCMSVLSN